MKKHFGVFPKKNNLSPKSQPVSQSAGSISSMLQERREDEGKCAESVAMNNVLADVRLWRCTRSENVYTIHNGRGSTYIGKDD